MVVGLALQGILPFTQILKALDQNLLFVVRFVYKLEIVKRKS